MSRALRQLVALSLLGMVACSLRSLDRLGAEGESRATGGSAGEGGTEAGAGVGGETSWGGVSSLGGSTAGGMSTDGGTVSMGGSGAAGGTDAQGGVSGEAGSTSTGGTSGEGGMAAGAGLAGAGSSGGGSGGGGTGGSAGAAGACTDAPGGCPFRDETPYLLKPGHDATKCADVEGFGINDGAALQQYHCFSQGNQVFWAEDHGAGRFALRNALSGKCLEVEDASLDPGARVRQLSCAGSATQLWRPVTHDSGYLLYAEHSGLVLDVDGSESTSDGSSLVQNPLDDLADSTWLFEVITRGAFMILSVPTDAATRARRLGGEVRMQATAGSDSEWKVLPGLSDERCVSFEARDQPGYFLRHSNFEMRSEPHDASSEFAANATFCYRAPFEGTDWVHHAIESWDAPGNFVVRENDTVALAPFEDTSEFRSLATWAVRQP